MHLLQEAEPAPDMLALIEARIDGEPRISRRAPVGVVVFVFLCGLAMGGLAVVIGQDRQSIVARTSAGAPWVPLGTVTLHGSGLRGFVEAKCDGNTHFFITMHGRGVADEPDETPVDFPLMREDEKIRMECIF